MHAYLWTNIGVGIFGIIARFALLARNKYPRITTYSAGEDAFFMLLTIAFVIWAWVLL